MCILEGQKGSVKRQAVSQPDLGVKLALEHSKEYELELVTSDFSPRLL